MLEVFQGRMRRVLESRTFSQQERINCLWLRMIRVVLTFGVYEYFYGDTLPNSVSQANILAIIIITNQCMTRIAGSVTFWSHE